VFVCISILKIYTLQKDVYSLTYASAVISLNSVHKIDSYEGGRVCQCACSVSETDDRVKRIYTKHCRYALVVVHVALHTLHFARTPDRL
jgi:hypothetical protein